MNGELRGARRLPNVRGGARRVCRRALRDVGDAMNAEQAYRMERTRKAHDRLKLLDQVGDAFRRAIDASPAGEAAMQLALLGMEVQLLIGSMDEEVAMRPAQDQVDEWNVSDRVPANLVRIARTELLRKLLARARNSRIRCVEEVELVMLLEEVGE